MADEPAGADGQDQLTEPTGQPDSGETQAPREQPRGAQDGASAGAEKATRTGPASRATGQRRGDGAFVPSHRLREANARAERAEQRFRELQAHLYRQPAGEPVRREAPAAIDPETQRVRDAFRQMYPQLAAFEDAGIDLGRLSQLVSQNGPIQSFEDLQQQIWRNVALGALRSVDAKVRDAYGPNVKPSTVRHFQSAFMSWIQDDEDRKNRYIENDPNLVDDFWHDTTGDVVEPIRESTQATLRTRAERVNNLPKFTGRTGPVGAQGKPKTLPKTEEELHDAAFDALIERQG
jgi:hypothetical protein